MGRMELPPNLSVLPGAQRPPETSNMMLVHKKTLSTIMRRSDWLDKRCKELQAALDHAALENQLMAEALGKAGGVWTQEQGETLASFKADFSRAYPGAPTTLDEIFASRVKSSIESLPQQEQQGE